MKIKTSEVKKIIDEEFIKVAREVRRLTERVTAATLREQPGHRGGTADTELQTAKMAAAQQIEDILKDLWNEGVGNEDLKGILTHTLENIDKGFVGEPT